MKDQKTLKKILILVVISSISIFSFFLIFTIVFYDIWKNQSQNINFINWVILAVTIMSSCLIVSFLSIKKIKHSKLPAPKGACVLNDFQDPNEPSVL